MKNRRKRAVVRTSVEEDVGIFKTSVIDVALELTPFTRKSSRGDAIYIGLLNGAEVEVVFPGRRVQALGGLKSALSRQSKLAGGAANLPIRAKGVWRTRNLEEEGLLTERIYQLVVSEWHIPDESGGGTSYGEPPLEA